MSQGLSLDVQLHPFIIFALDVRLGDHPCASAVLPAGKRLPYQFDEAM